MHLMSLDIRNIVTDFNIIFRVKTFSFEVLTIWHIDALIVVIYKLCTRLIDLKICMYVATYVTVQAKTMRPGLHFQIFFQFVKLVDKDMEFKFVTMVYRNNIMLRNLSFACESKLTNVTFTHL